MPTLIKKKIKKSRAREIQNATDYYMRKYYNIFMHQWTIEGLDYQQEYFLLNELWEQGRITAFKIPFTESEEYPNGMLCLTPFSELQYNIYNFPSMINYINLRGASFIPSTPQRVDEDCCIMYALNSRRPVKEIIAWNVERIVLCETLISINCDTLKLPFLIASTPENKESLKGIIDAILEGESKVYVDIGDINSIKTLINSNPYILDKLMQYKDARENEVLTILGINNNNTQEKSQYINIDTINSNNQEIEDASCQILDNLKSFAERIEYVLGISINPRLRHERKEVDKDVQDSTGVQDE